LYPEGVRSLLAAALVAAAACGAPPLPAYDTTIGVHAIPVAPGALAGTFALYLEVATIVTVPLPGVDPQPGGGDSWFLVTRTFDAKTGYHETHRLCGGRIWDVMGTKTTISDAARRMVPAEAVRSVAVSPAGDYALDGHLELWGLAGLPDPYNTDLPTDAAGFQQAPAKDWVVDMDGDGHPGMTAHVQGFASGDVYFVQRRRINLEGVTRGADRVFGLDFADARKVTIGATSSLLAQPTPVAADPNPQRSWFDETRLPAGATCDEVSKVVADGVIGKVRPF
jgi:hypothetical protein